MLVDLHELLDKLDTMLLERELCRKLGDGVKKAA